MFTYVLPLLIFPFYWDHAYIPVLPMVDDPAVFFDAPCPFIMGFKIDCKSPARDDLPFEIREEVGTSCSDRAFKAVMLMM